MPDPSQFGPRRLLVPLVGLLIGVLPILGYALQFGAKQRVGVLSFSVAVALAAGLVGCFLGFLFAIPRFDITDRDIRDVGKYGRGGWLHNTNLSQISDWLTKILVGVGLTQFAASEMRLVIFSSNSALDSGGLTAAPHLAVCS